MHVIRANAGSKVGALPVPFLSSPSLRDEDEVVGLRETACIAHWNAEGFQVNPLARGKVSYIVNRLDLGIFL